MRKLPFILTAIALVAMSPTAHAALLLHSFEGTDDGYVTDGPFGAATVAPDNSGVFATDGTYSLRIEGQTDSYSQPAKADVNPADLDNAAYDTISFDYYLPGFAGGYAVMGIRIAAETWGGNDSTTILSDTGTVSWNYKSDASYTPGAAWAVFILDGFNEAGSGSVMSPVYIDNVQLSLAVPEPGSFVLLGVALAMLSVARHRKDR